MIAEHVRGISGLSLTRESDSSRGQGLVPKMKDSEATRGSAAEFAGLQPGDVIEPVDGKPVRTPAELAAAISGHVRSDKVKLGFMVKAYWRKQ